MPQLPTYSQCFLREDLDEIGEILRFRVYFQVKESFIRTVWVGVVLGNATCQHGKGHRAVLLPIWKSTQHVPAQPTRSHPVFIEIMGELNVKCSVVEVSYCVLIPRWPELT